MTGEGRTELSSSPCMAEEVEKGLFDPLASQERSQWQPVGESNPSYLVENQVS
jgi:hypothetical protein